MKIRYIIMLLLILTLSFHNTEHIPQKYLIECKKTERRSNWYEPEE